MKRPVTLLINLLLAGLPLVGSLLLGGCGSENQDILSEPVLKPADEPTYTLSLQIMTGAIMSRAENIWNDDYTSDYGTTFDNTIQSLALFLVSEEGGVTRLYAVKDPNSAAYIYTCQVNDKTPGVTMSADKKSATFNGKIMALANLQEGNIPVNSADDWLDTQIPYRVGFGKNAGWHIPMWGIATFNKTLTPNQTTHLGDIDMLRSVSKLVVKLDPQLEGEYMIDSINMADDSALYYSAGYALPGNNPLDAQSTKSLGIAQCFNAPAATDALPEAPQWHYNITNEGETAVVNGAYTYVSESETDHQNPFKFTVKLRSRKTELHADFTGTLYFAKYDVNYPSETVENITRAVRNHIYEFTITLAEMQLETTVRQWVFGGAVHIDM